MPPGVMVIAEQRDGEIRKVSYEIVSEGKRLADKLGQKVTAVLLGHNIKAKAATLGHYGADKIIVADDAKLANYVPDAYASVIAQVVKANDPAVLILGASVQGKAHAGRTPTNPSTHPGALRRPDGIAGDAGRLVAQVRP